MNITLFGATGALGSQCLQQTLAAGHNITVLVRSTTKLPAVLLDKITVVEGDALSIADIRQVLTPQTDAILFAIGVDKHSPENLCTDITQHIIHAMKSADINRLIFCGGGSTFVEGDQITLGAKFVRKFAEIFMPLRHFDKERQYELLQQFQGTDFENKWLGLRPLQMKQGSLKANYRIGFNTFNGMSSISFADCAHAMVGMLDDDTWLGKAPIIQY